MYTRHLKQLQIVAQLGLHAPSPSCCKVKDIAKQKARLITQQTDIFTIRTHKNSNKKFARRQNANLDHVFKKFS